MDEKTKALIMFLLLNDDKEVRYGHSIERSSELTPEDFTVEDGIVFLNTYEGM